MSSPQLIIFPETYRWFIGKEHKELLHNIKSVRAQFHKLVEERRMQLADPNFQD
jgi:hypothetical protein